MKLTASKYLVLGFGLPLLFFLSSLGYVSYRAKTRSYDFSEAKYQKDYAWNGVEVGTVLRFPVGGVGREQRHFAIVAFHAGQTGRHYLLATGPNALNPERPRFVSADQAMVTYELPIQGRTNFNLNAFFNAGVSVPR